MVETSSRMARARLVAQLWDWLPAFRAVAETEHLPTAADAMRVSPSALSRAVRLLEEATGQTLFDRIGRSITLNERGRILLASVRDAMRGVHSALEFIESGLLSGPVRLSVPAPWQSVVVPPAVSELSTDHPDLTIEAVVTTSDSVAPSLRQGNIDVAITDTEISTDQLTCQLVRECDLGIYVPAGHPLTKRRSLRWEDVLRSDYISVSHYGRSVWRLEQLQPRVSVTDPETAATLCRRQKAWTVLPDLLAESLGLVRLGLRVEPAMPLYMLHRPTLTIPGRTEALADVLRATLA